MTKDKTIMITFLVKFIGIDNVHIKTDDRLFIKAGSSKTRLYPIVDYHVFFEHEVFVRQATITESTPPKILLPPNDVISVFRENHHKTFFHRRDTKVGECVLKYRDFMFAKKAFFVFPLVYKLFTSPSFSIHTRSLTHTFF